MIARRSLGALAFGLFVLGSGRPVPAQQATFRARQNLVRLDVMVADRGQPIRTLKAEDFQIRDDGVPQTVELIDFEELPLNAVLALDLSGSVTGDRLEQLRSACRTALGVLKAGDRAALIGFSHAVETRAALTTDLPSVVSSLRETRARGDTALYDASYVGLSVGESDPSSGRSLLIILSDGQDTSSWLAPDDVLEVARRSGVVVYAVVVREPLVLPPSNTRASPIELRRRAEVTYGERVPDEKPVFLRDLANLTGGALVELESAKDLDAVFGGIVNEFHQRYLLGYTPTGVSDTGWHKVDVRVKGRSGLTVKARPGYVAGG